MKVEVTKEHLEQLLDYCYSDEERHYEESEQPTERHIFLTIKKLKDEIS